MEAQYSIFSLEFDYFCLHYLSRLRMFSPSYMDKSCLKTASLILIALVLASCGTRKLAVSQYETTTIQDDILAYSKKHLGKPYRYAGKGPNAFDCSGFTSFVFRSFGYRLNSSSAGQDRQVPTIARREELRKGDLVFFEGSRRNGRVGHVGIVSELLPSGQFRFIHASTTSGVIISSSSEPYYAARYLRGGRVLEENASYVTRQNPATARQQKPDRLTSMDPSFPPASIQKAMKSGTEKKVSIAANDPDSPVVVVQAGPSKNIPLPERNRNNDHAREAGKSNQKNGGIEKANSDMVLRENSSEIPSPPINHTVRMGETLYSISRQYGCTVDQLKRWNPQLKSVLQAGEALLIYH